MSELTKDGILKILKNGTRVRVQKSEVIPGHFDFQLISEGYFFAGTMIEDYMTKDLTCDIFGEKIVELMEKYKVRFIIQRECKDDKSKYPHWFVSFSFNSMMLRAMRIRESHIFGDFYSLENLGEILRILIESGGIEDKAKELSGV